MSHSDELDTISETAVRHHDVITETRQIFNSFMSIPEAYEDRRGVTRYASFELGLEFPTDIQSDSVSTPTEQAERFESEDDRLSNGNTEEKYRKVGLALQRMGDDINDNFFKKNSDVEMALKSLSEDLIKGVAENVFQEAIENILKEFTGSFPNQEEKYKVALVMLCTKRSLGAMTSAVSSAKEASEAVIRESMTFIAQHYPSWISNFSL